MLAGISADSFFFAPIQQPVRTDALAKVALSSGINFYQICDTFSCLVGGEGIKSTTSSKERNF
jgi:hypothetical protein